MKRKGLIYEYSVWTRYRPRPFEGTQYPVFLQLLEDGGLIKRIPTRKGVMCEVSEITSEQVWSALDKFKDMSIWRQWRYSRAAHKRLKSLAVECKKIDPWENVKRSSVS